VGTKVSQLDYSSWNEQQIERLNALRYRHPLQSALREVKPESIERSERGEIRLSARDYGNGHRECAVWLHKPDLQKTLDRAIERDLGVLTDRGEGDREASRVRGSRRATQKVRISVKAMAANSLWTLTTRQPVTDRAMFWKLIDSFRRRVVTVLGEWKYVAVIEPQERGALHAHMATHALPVRLLRGGVRVKSWDVMRKVWADVLRKHGMDGSFDEAKQEVQFGVRKGRRKSFKNAGQIARYIAGYVAKDFRNSELNHKRYSVTKGLELPVPVREAFAHDADMVGLIELAYAAVGERITSAFWCKESRVFYVESDDSVTGSG
jgi:hypothetical protein